MDSFSRFDRITLKLVKYREQNLYVAFILFRRNIDKVVAGHVTDLYLPSAVAQVFVDQLHSIGLETVEPDLHLGFLERIALAVVNVHPVALALHD